MSPLNVEAHYMLGCLYVQLEGELTSKESCNDEAIIHFEQVIKHNQSLRATNDSSAEEKFKETGHFSQKALHEIIKIHIKSRDFYQAQYEINRAIHFNFPLHQDQKPFEIY